MAFARSGLCRVGGSGTGGSTWQYSSADSKATIVTSGYMNAAYDELALGDVVTCVTSTTPPTAFITYVKTRASAVVALAGGLVITA
jgi:hypothetical protein